MTEPITKSNRRRSPVGPPGERPPGKLSVPGLRWLDAALIEAFAKGGQLRIARVVVGGSVAASVVTFGLALSRLWLGPSDPVGYVLAAAAAAFGTVAAVAVRRRSLRWSGLAMPGVGFAAIVAMSTAESGLFSEGLFFLPFVPLVSLLTRGQPSSFVFVSLGIAWIGVLFAGDPTAKDGVPPTLLHAAGLASAVGFAGLLGAVYERARLQSMQEVERAKRAALRASDAKTTFLTKMSHELRTPLNSVIGFSNLLLRKGDSLDESTRRAHLERIRNSGGQLLAIIGDILDISQLDLGELSLRLNLVTVAPLLTHAVDRVAVQARARSLKIHLDAAPGPRVLADADRLTQAVSNLIANAIKFTESPGDIWVTLVCNDADQPLRVDVSDTGIGVEPDLLERMYEPFSQGDESATRSRFGAGLGLSIAQRICIEMGFELHAVSIVGRGSTFSILFGSGSNRPSTEELVARLSVASGDAT